uniref:Uncharacterized protein n=1 Tax=Cacopsylla melanoneura TaxID=428564 RepID=A0A8D8U748_9HEMI
MNDVSGHVQRLLKRSRRYKGSLQLNTQFTRHVSERFQILHVLRDTHEIFVVKRVLGIEHGEHLLVEDAEEIVHHFYQIDISLGEVFLQLFKQVGKQERVLFVDDAVRSLEHVVE